MTERPSAGDSSANPYAPPAEEATLEPGRARRFPTPASLDKRFFGATIDGLFYVACFGVPMFLVKTLTGAPLSSGLLTWLLTLPYYAIQAYLIAHRGQSVGKIVVKTRIVTTDGRQADLYRGFVLRQLLFIAPNMIVSLLLELGEPATLLRPLRNLVTIVSVIDILFILGTDRRCLHDYFAGTRVALDVEA
jgi:uncharacterized RDD family membrane protein YckC